MALKIYSLQFDVCVIAIENFITPLQSLWHFYAVINSGSFLVGLTKTQTLL